jgi:hypothetical protein
MKILLSFVFSGIVPIPSDMGSAVPYSQSGVIQFMCSQLIGLIIGDLVGKVCSRAFGQPKFSTRMRNCGKTLGYFWVLAFLMWSGPVRWYPVIRMQTKETEMIRPSVFRTLARPLARIDHLSDERIVMPAISAPFKCFFSLASNKLKTQNIFS